MKRLNDKQSFFFFFIVIITVITSCTTNLHISVPTPEIGKSNLRGYLVDGNGLPLRNTTVRLAEVYRESENSENGAYLLDTAFSPGTITDASGFFLFQNIEPGEYVLVVGDIENNKYEIISQQNGLPRVWLTIADQVMDIGIIKVNY